MTSVRVRRVEAQLGPTGGSWPSTDADWIEWTGAIVREAAEGHANDVGNAVVAVPFGLRALPGSTEDAEEAFLPITGAGTLLDPGRLSWAGRYMRLRAYDENGENPAAFWWGWVAHLAYQPREDGVGYELVAECRGILSTLDYVVVSEGPELGVTSAGATAITYTPEAAKANAAHGDSGDRSDSLWTVGGRTVYALDRVNAGRQAFSAWHMADSLLAVAETRNGQLRWALGGQYLTALAYIDTWKLYGLTVREALTRIINPRYGCTFSVFVDDETQTPTILVESVLPEAVSSGTVDLPARNRAVEIDVATELSTTLISYAEDHAQTFDRVVMEAPPHVEILTVEYDAASPSASHLEPAYSTADKAAWIVAPEEERESGKLASVYRRFRLKDTWRGQSRGVASEWPATRATQGSEGGPDDLYGAAGYTGEWSSGSNPTAYPYGRRHTIDRLLPIYEGYDWTSVTEWDRTRPTMRPLLFVRSGSTWFTAKEYLDRDLALSVDEDAGEIIIGSNADDAQQVSDLIAEGAVLAVTIAVRHPFARRVSWNRPAADQPRAEPRILVRHFPEAEHVVLRGTAVLGVSSGSAESRGSDLVVVDARPKLRDALALGRPFYENPGRAAVIHTRDLDVSSTFRPGALVERFIMPDGDGGSIVLLGNDVLARRRWKLSEGPDYGTYYSTIRLAPDLEALQ